MYLAERIVHSTAAAAAAAMYAIAGGVRGTWWGVYPPSISTSCLLLCHRTSAGPAMLQPGLMRLGLQARTILHLSMLVVVMNHSLQWMLLY
jgi:hypothetical protein